MWKVTTKVWQTFYESLDHSFPSSLQSQLTYGYTVLPKASLNHPGSVGGVENGGAGIFLGLKTGG